jgi:hypothetical protein
MKYAPLKYMEPPRCARYLTAPRLVAGFVDARHASQLQVLARWTPGIGGLGDGGESTLNTDGRCFCVVMQRLGWEGLYGEINQTY